MTIPEITTPLPDLVLRELTSKNVTSLHSLLQQNRAHLTAHGDYSEQVSATVAEIEAELADDKIRRLRFGIFLGGELIGRIDLNGVDPPRYGIGYWLAEGATGKGYATHALEAVIGFAGEVLGASDIYAGVTHGNLKSTALLERLGFRQVASFESYSRFHCRLS